jgi:hypothetical protein
MLDQAVEVIRKRVDYFGAANRSSARPDRILVQFPALSTRDQEARPTFPVAKLEFTLSTRKAELIPQIEAGQASCRRNIGS